jgi:hypothetical protein
MEVYVDGEILTPQPATDSVIRDVTDQLREQLNEKHRLVVRIGCDGEDVAESDLERTLDAALSDYGRVDLHTALVSDLAADLLSQTTEMLEKAREVQSEVVDLLSQGNNGRAMELLSDCFTVWKNAQEGLQRAAEAMELELDDIRFEEETVTAFMGEVAAALRTIREALELRDYVMLSDVLAYEFDPLTERWQHLNEAVREQIR